MIVFILWRVNWLCLKIADLLTSSGKLSVALSRVDQRPSQHVLFVLLNQLRVLVDRNVGSVFLPAAP